MLAPLLEVRMLKKCTLLWRAAHFEVKNVKRHQGFATTFGGSDVEKVHAVVARRTFPSSQNVSKTLRVLFSKSDGTFGGSIHVEKVHALSCGAKHISKSKC